MKTSPEYVQTYQPGPGAVDAEEQERDKPLCVRARAELPLLGMKTTEVERRILLAALMEAKGAGRRISYSRNKNHYPGMARYKGQSYTYGVVSAVDRLEAQGLIDQAIAAPWPCGWQSTLWAAPALLALAVPESVELDPAESIRLRKGGRLVSYSRDMEKPAALRKRLRPINEALADTSIELPALPGVTYRGPLVEIDRPEKNGPVVVNTSHDQLYRVFNEDLSHGGRFYGGWWQGLPGEYRLKLLIDGEPVVEADYTALHANMAYEWSGVTPFHEDMYELAGWERSICKMVFQVLLNAKSYQAAVGAVAKAMAGQDDIAPFMPLARKLIQAIKHKHHAIAKLFHKGLGLKFQYQDSQMAERVMRALVGRGIPVLGVHDSFLVASRHRGILQEEMAKMARIIGLFSDETKLMKLKADSGFVLTSGERGPRREGPG